MFGHWDVVTCLAYSRHVGLTGGDAFVVSGSRDATVLVWRWSERLQRVTASERAEGEYEIHQNPVGREQGIIDRFVRAILVTVLKPPLHVETFS